MAMVTQKMPVANSSQVSIGTSVTTPMLGLERVWSAMLSEVLSMGLVVSLRCFFEALSFQQVRSQGRMVVR